MSIPKRRGRLSLVSFQCMYPLMLVIFTCNVLNVLTIIVCRINKEWGNNSPIEEGILSYPGYCRPFKHSNIVHHPCSDESDEETRLVLSARFIADLRRGSAQVLYPEYWYYWRYTKGVMQSEPSRLYIIYLVETLYSKGASYVYFKRSFLLSC